MHFPLLHTLLICSPSAQVVPHGVVPFVYVHDAAMPLQTPAHAVPAPSHAARVPCGVPLGTGTQRPTDPATSQAWHEPVHALSQHTPSTHAAPLPAHESATEQGWLWRSRAAHAPSLQYALGSQSELVVHVRAQIPFTQRAGVQSVPMGASAHDPLPSHVSAVDVLLMHALPHAVPAT